MSGRMRIVSGHVLTLILNHAKNIVKRARVMENTLPQSVNATKTTTALDVSIGMSVRQMQIVAFRENALTLVGLHCHENNATANWVGLEADAIKVSLNLTCYPQVFFNWILSFDSRIVHQVNRH